MSFSCMNAHPPMWRLFVLLLGISLAAARADDVVRPDDARLRTAITKGLDFLVKEGDAWLNERNCNACHHLPELLWSHREAKRRGIPIDQAKFDEFSEWAFERTKNPKKVDEMFAFMKLALPDRPMPELTKLIVEGQEPDGSWKPGGQFASMQRRDVKEATANSARVFLLALATQEVDKAAAEAARAKAAALLAGNAPPKSVETLFFRTLYARRFGPSAEVDALRAEILKLQHADGGWGWMIGEAQSDPLATGEVLYLLQQSPDTAPAEAIARAQNWLLHQQREDGGWPIDITRISKIDRSAPGKEKSFKEATMIYTFWGSAWATIGLLEGLPVSESPDTPER